MVRTIPRLVIFLLMQMIGVSVILSVQTVESVKNSTSDDISGGHESSQNYFDKINLSNNIGHSEDPQIVVSGQNIYVSWLDDSLGKRNIYFTKSGNNGCRFDPPIVIDNQSGSALDTQIAASDNKIYMIWEHSPGNNGQIYFSRSIDNGITFEKIRNMGNNTGFNGFPQIAASGNNVYLIWHDATKGILFTRSTDSGASFESIRNIGNASGSNEFPQLALSGNKVYALWINNADKKYGQIFFTNSSDNGITFEEPAELGRKSDHEPGRSVYNPRLAIDLKGDNVYVVWQSGKVIHQYTGNINALISDVLYKRSTDNGASFGETINLSNYSGWSANPRVAVSQNNSVYVVWTNAPQQKYGEIFLTRSTDNGASFGKTINLSNYSGWSANPRVAVSQNNSVYVVSSNNATGNEETMLTKYKNPNNCTLAEHENKFYKNEKIDMSFLEQLKIAFVDPTFTIAAYDSSFYLFYDISKSSPEILNHTSYLDLLSSKIPQNWRDSRESDDIMAHLKWLLPVSSVSFITDKDVDDGSLIFSETGKNKYNVLILSHQEYVTQKEYDNLKRFVANGGILFLLDGNAFYAEVKYDKVLDKITLVKGHDWAFNGKTAWKDTAERWLNDTSQWVGSNYLCCYSDDIVFKNNPFEIKHDEEQYITNPKAKILLDYNATENKINPRKFVIATYELDYKKGKVITLGLYTDDLKGNQRFWKFFDSLVYQYVIANNFPNQNYR